MISFSFFRVAVLMGAGCITAVPQLIADNTALSFDGASSYVTFGPAPGLGASNFTVEVWFKRLGTGTATSTGSGGVTAAIPLVTKGRSENDNAVTNMNYFLGIGTNNLLVADFEDFATGGNHPVSGVTTITNGAWYHAAVTYNGTAWALYLNGALETSLTVSQTPRYDSIQHAGIGTAMNSAGAASGFFNGILDEVRIWNYARTAQQIADNKNAEITAAPGLIGRWGLNEGTGSTITSTAGSGISGMLVNSPSWVAGFQPGVFTAVAQGDTWRYFKGNVAFPANWTTNNFDDSLWLTGPSSIGYGDNDDATMLTDMQGKYATVLMRKQFVVSNVASITAVTLGADYDDGFVAYVNGIEVARRGVTGADVNTGFATSHEASTGDTSPQPKEYIAITNNLVVGTNVLAVSGHNTSLASTDLTTIFDLTFSTNTPAAAVILRGPYLQAATATRICVMTECLTTNAVTVEYGLTTAYGNSSQTTTTATTTVGTVVHMVKLSGLQPNTLYHYRVATGDTNSTDATFHTLVEAGTNFRFAWMADCRAPGTTIHDAVSALIAPANPLFSLYGGDLCDVSGVGLYSAFTNEFFRPNELALITTVPFYNAVGNHETWGQNTKAFTEAPPSASGTEDYYSFDCGDLHVLVLNYILGYLPGSAQYNFATNDLATSTKPWKIVTCHEPAYVFGGNHTPSAGIRNLATNCFEKVGVDVMFSGHTHFFEHILTNNVHYLIVGSAGAELKVPAADPSVVASASSYCYAITDVTYTNLSLVVYDDHGAILDSLNLTKPPLPVAVGFLSPPTVNHAGTALVPPVQVAVMDINGNTNVPATVTVALGNNPAGGALFGTLTVPTVGGIATFSNLQIDKLGSGYTLVATVGGLSVTSTVFTVLFPDQNHNNVADNWETDFFGGMNVSNGAAGADWDGDGLSNLAEFTAGTNPTNSTDSFRLNISATNGQVIVSFQALATTAAYNTGQTRHYRLESCTNLLTGGWTPLHDYADVLGTNQTVTVTNAPATGPAFYRGKAWLQTP